MQGLPLDKLNIVSISSIYQSKFIWRLCFIDGSDLPRGGGDGTARLGQGVVRGEAGKLVHGMKKV